MSVVIAMEEAGPSRLKLTLEVPTAAVEAETGRVVKEFRRHVRLPGFRPGKVPVPVVKKRFADEIEKEVVERLLPRYWEQAKAEKSLDPLTAPAVEELVNEEGEPMRVHLVVETRPEIAISDLEFELPAKAGEPTEDDVDEALTDLRRTFAEWNVVEREAAQGDLVVGVMRNLDVEPAGSTTEDDGAEDDGAENDGAENDASEGEETAGDVEAGDVEAGDVVPEARPIHVEIGGRGVDERLSLELTGKKAGDVVLHTETHGEGETAHEHRVEIEIREIKEQSIPELDDEFLEKIGQFETVDDLRETLTRSVGARKEEEAGRQRMDALLQQLRDRHPVELPKGVVQQESERIVREQAENMARQGVDLENANIDWEGMLGSIQPVAEKRVHERLVLDAVAKHLGLRLDEEKFEGFLAMAAADQKVSSLALRQRLTEDGRIEGLRAQLLRDQTVQHLLGETGGDDEESQETAPQGAEADTDETDDGET